MLSGIAVAGTVLTIWVLTLSSLIDASWSWTNARETSWTTVGGCSFRDDLRDQRRGTLASEKFSGARHSGRWHDLDHPRNRPLRNSWI